MAIINKKILKERGLSRCFVLLSGRGQSIDELFNLYLKYTSSTLIGLEPKAFSWYPSPTSNHIDKVLEGIQLAVSEIKNEINKVASEHNIPEFYICGFSAGAVVAAQTVFKSDYKGIIHSGAIFNLKDVPKGNNTFILTHGGADMVFKWDERYLPMCTTLTVKGYDVKTFEEKKEGHRITDSQMEKIKKLLGE